MKYLLIIFN